MKQSRRIVLGILLVTGSIFAGVALSSFDPLDRDAIWRARNLCGPFGAMLAGAARYLLGPALSWAFPVFLFFWSLVYFTGARMGAFIRRIVGAVLLVWTLSALAASAGGAGYGGLVGEKTAQFLGIALGRIGSVLVLTAIALLVLCALFFRWIRRIAGGLSGLRFPPLRLPRFRRPERKTRAAGPQRMKSPPQRAPAEQVREIETAPLRIAEPKRKAPKRKVPKEPVRTERLSAASTAGANNAPLPDPSILDAYDTVRTGYSKDELIARSEVIEAKLKDFGLEGKVKEVWPGPVVTTFEFVPAPGVKVSQIANRSDDIALALAARAIRIQAPIPGKGAVGIEVPNPEPQLVVLREMMDHFPDSSEGLSVALGKTVSGEPYYADLADMPHLLIAGATGSGKSVCINSIICSLLFTHTPATCRFILIDPKRLELISYNDIPHLLHPVITEAKDTLKVLQLMTIEMDRRYRLLASVGVKNIAGFNRKVASRKVPEPETGEPLERLPYYITIIDELADIMVTVGNEIYPPITRLSQMARAVGIHLVFATQRPSVDVVTGLIKANFPCRIAFQVTSKTDSRTILDVNGGEKLLGNGDMLYLPKNQPSPMRLQGAFISETEAERVASYWRRFRGEGEELDLSEEASAAGGSGSDAEIDDELYNKAKELVIMHQQGSISLVQRRLRVGYARAARLIDMLEQAGVVGPFEGSKARRVLISREEYDSV